MEYLIRKSDFFTWEELPTRDPDTGYVTKAGYIPTIQSLTKYVAPILFAFHAVQSTVRVVMSHDMVFTTWTPFDVTASPLYELANVIQVLYMLLFGQIL
jgi:hypothetical protein